MMNMYHFVWNYYAQKQRFTSCCENLSTKLALLRIKNHEAMGSNKISGAKDFHYLAFLETGN